MKLITDKDLCSIDIGLAAESICDFLISANLGETVSPPRALLPLENETLAFTAGADSRNFGFRAYAYRAGLQRDKEDQVVACWDRKTHSLKALAVGELLGAWRTGILGGIAYQTLAGPKTEMCGVVGTGLQAYTQVRAIAELAKPKQFSIFSRNRQRRYDFAKKLEEDTNISTIVSDSVEQLVRQSDAVVIATNASRPVFKIEWLERCRHISTVGPKARNRHETPVDVSDWAERIVSDSPQQIAKQGADHFLADALALEKIDDLSRILASDYSGNANLRSLYLSAGLSGTEVALLAAIANGASGLEF